jgi:poly [ADP-ribose] polymerase
MECGKQVFPDKMEKLVKTRPDGNPELYQKANVIPLFHGTRTENLTGILKKGLLIRPSGVVLCGNAYGNGIYKSSNSTKSINYTSINCSYWAKGSDNKAYLFLSDAILGNTYMAKNSGNYSLNSIKPNHSLWARAGKQLINDEMILYKTDQHTMKYLLEFTCTGR